MAFEDQLKAGISFPCPPQLKDMILMFAEDLERQECGITLNEGKVWITSKLKPPKNPVVIQDLLWASNYLKENKAGVDGIKIAVTGPLTLASVALISENQYAIEYPDLVLSLASVVKEITRHFCEHGANLITLDEPALSYALWVGLPEDAIIKSIDVSLETAEKQIKSVHVCGKIDDRIASILLKTKASILCHEFKGNTANLDAYSKQDLELYDKLLGLGCVQTRPVDNEIPIETVEEVENFVLNASNIFGLGRLFLVPDCGFKGLLDVYKDERTAQQVASKKMIAMTYASKRIVESATGGI
jgi:methionine synthase II (cobalamin-independent)